MLPRRPLQQGDSLEHTGEMAALETARSAIESSREKPEEKKNPEESISLFWRLFGGTVLSIAALVAITLYNHTSSSINELRAEVSREREARAELVKKDEFSSRNTSLYERIRGIDALRAELEGLKEKVHNNAAAVETARKDTAAAVDGVRKDSAAIADAMKKDAAALEVLKERVTGVEAVKKDIASLETIKEKLAAATVDLRTLRDDLAKLTGEVEKNKSYDLERKALRDSQHKQIEDTLKEVQKGLQDCREKLARLEGAKPAPAAGAATKGSSSSEEGK